MISCRLMGGLGNYMFQIGAAYTHAKHMSSQLIVDVNDIVQVHKPYREYLQNVFRKITFGNPNVEFVYNEPSFTHTPIPQIDNIKLIGYFQSEKYFDRELILELFDLSELISNDLTYLSDIINSDSVSIHVRRGDYVGLQNHHPLCSVEYYKVAIEYFGNDKKYFVFSDDIDWCKQFFVDIDVTFVEGLCDWHEMYLMSVCKHNIIANSTFSWWGAWLNKNNNMVIAPKNWFGPAKQISTLDLIPTQWVTM